MQQNTFLFQVLQTFTEKDLAQLGNYCFVFPTRRAARIFENMLLQKFAQHTFWAPSFFSIADFVQEMCQQTLGNDIGLLLELYQVYVQTETADAILPLDTFLPWGEVLLKDFDEIDKYLVDADALFSILGDIKEIESIYGADNDAFEAVARLRNILSAEEKTELMQRFLRIWQQLPYLYKHFKATLQEKNIAYEGMLYRNFCDLLHSPDYQNPYEKIVFAGFNALSKTEESIFDSLLQQEKAVVFWDYDIFFEENPSHEAAVFLRKYRQKWQHASSYWISSNFWQSGQTIHLYPRGGTQAQLFQAAQLLRETVSYETTAVVLADEALLVPLLHYLPPTQQENINVTMGYPLQATPVPQLIQAFLDWHALLASHSIKAEVVLPFVENPYMQQTLPEAFAWIHAHMLQYRTRYFSLSVLKENIDWGALSWLLEASDDIGEILARIQKLLVHLIHSTSNEDTSVQTYFSGKIILQHSLVFIQNFTQNIQQYLPFISLASLQKILLPQLSVQRIPFKSDENAALQVMGFLETRNLDFERIIVLSLNEGKIPAARSMDTFLPFYLRKAHKMPTFEEQDTIFAYHFFRLLGRSTNVHLLYDNSTSGNNKGEASRFITQLEYADILYENVKLSINNIPEKVAIARLDYQMREIMVHKSEHILAQLKSYTAGGEKYISPTSLLLYHECPLRFYFKYLAKMSPPEEVENNVTPLELGTVVHHSLEILYQKFQGKTMEKGDILSLASPENLQQAITAALQKNYFLKENESLTGFNLLQEKVIMHLVKNVLTHDAHFSTPLQIVSVEEESWKINYPLPNGTIVQLSGKIDRLDIPHLAQNQHLRLVDYKTGKVEALTYKNSKNAQDFTETVWSSNRYKAQFQLLFYALLYLWKNPSKEILLAIYNLGALQENTYFFSERNILSWKLEDFNAYRNHLDESLTELFDPAQPFVQTADTKNCTFCDYREICRVSAK
ncbi:MAG: PD-(D/E)XK nuclease family protein [Chitinophagales bacterium]|nr:PD-(D/E)XK nuclease family protein [Bacteroidota bacterium]MCB9044367.1 PD-(D/E)XK nuclease family protein [Chitinophagales bacterium]